MKKQKRGLVSSGSREGVGVEDLLALLPDNYLEELALELGADKWVQKLKAATLFKLVLFSLLTSERLSLRVLEQNFRDPFFSAMAGLLEPEQVRWTGIRERLIHLHPDFARRLYEEVFKTARQVYGGATLQGYHIRRYDSTLIATFAHLLKGMKVGNSSEGKRQVKLTTRLEDEFLIQMSFHCDQRHLSEEVALGEALGEDSPEPNRIQVFDRGVKSRATFSELSQKGTLFISRLQDNSRYEVLYPNWQDDGLSDTEALAFVQDSVIRLYQSGRGATLKPKWRLVQYRVKKTAQLLSFLTNVWDLDACSIAEAYSRRWDIEVLFRFLKQEMNLSHFVCNEKEAIESMLYFTLIASMLVLIYKKQNNLTSYKRAKTAFVKELLFSITMDLAQHPQYLQYLKEHLKSNVKKE